MPLVSARLPLWQRIWILRGRARRFCLGVFRKGYVRQQHARRVGECLRCGACCQMGIRCPQLTDDGDLSGCRKYDRRRPINCVNFPIDERDLAERDLIAPDQPCGYRFLAPDEAPPAGESFPSPTAGGAKRTPLSQRLQESRDFRSLP